MGGGFMNDKPIYYETGDLCHYGVLGMKWGVRRARKNAAKANKLYKKSSAQYKKASTNSASLFGTEKGTLKKAVNAGEKGNAALVKSRKADAIIQKHETKYAKQVAKNEKKLKKAINNGADKEKIAKIRKKGETFVKEYKKLLKDIPVSNTEAIDRNNDRIYKLIDQMDKRIEWRNRISNY